jgi:pyruvate,orthophosphate dikinase
MQCQAIFEAAVYIKVHGADPNLEIMVPLISSIEEMRNQTAIIRSVAEQVFKEKGATVKYIVGTMIELPRAALTADQIAEEAEFFSFGTNDLTQTTFGISRDDINQFLPAYMKHGIFKQDPFATLDQAGVGQLVQMAATKGRKTRPNIHLGICGEHGGDPESVKFCHRAGLNYVSCSPFRLLTARLAAAQAAVQEIQTGPDIHSGTC